MTKGEIGMYCENILNHQVLFHYHLIHVGSYNTQLVVI